MVFANEILEWYSIHKRPLPWRTSTDPYNIWLSEIMLQQTRVAQGTPYYLKFIDQFPTVAHLAAAEEGEVLKLWQGLGYYSRARNLHATAKKVAYELNGNFPKNYDGLILLKGVGDYTASAIASICFNEKRAVLDGNVFRVLARYFGVRTPINDSKGPKYFKKLAEQVMSSDNIRDYNQGIMEFGALQCTPKNPNCNECPLNGSCIAFAEDLVGELPVKLKKTKVRKRYFNYLVVLGENDKQQSVCLLQQRTGKGIWQNLWEFPLIESKEKIGLSAITKLLPNKLVLNSIADVALFNEKEIVHKLSHQHLYTRFWVVSTNDTLASGIQLSKIQEFAVPVLIADFLKAFKF